MPAILRQFSDTIMCACLDQLPSSYYAFDLQLLVLVRYNYRGKSVMYWALDKQVLQIDTLQSHDLL